MGNNTRKISRRRTRKGGGRAAPFDEVMAEYASLQKLMLKAAEERMRKEAEEFRKRPKPKNRHLPEEFSEGFIRRMTAPVFDTPLSELKGGAADLDFRVSWLEAAAGAGVEADPSFPVVPVSAVQTEPTVTWIGPEPHILVAWDPDAPAASWLHWLVANGRVLVPWAPPAPPPGTGTHRYEFAVFQGQRGPAPKAPSQRGHFSVEDFVKKYGLQRLTAPIGIRVAAE